MASVKEMQQDAMASIDTAKAMVDKVLTVMQLITSSPSLSLTFATNPIGFLLQMLKHLGVTYEELRDFITNFIIYIIPLLEVSVKTIMLTNLKNMVGCATDPRIPDKYRKRHKEITNPNTSQEYGIDISLESIDFFNKLTINPLSKEGKEYYFGLDGIEDVYKFARAEDFDAFLWFVMHKGKFPNASSIKEMEDFKTVLGAESYNGSSLLEKVELTYNPSSSSHILVGNTFTYGGDNKVNSHILSLCIDSLYNKDNKITNNTLVPVSDDWNSVNWYVNRGNYFTNNLGIGKKKTRDYNKEAGICNIQFLDQSNTQDSPLTGLINNKFRLTILPKPYVHIPSSGEPPWRFKKLLFNSQGEFDSNGKYTIVGGSEETTNVFIFNNKEYSTLEEARRAVKDVYPKKDEQSETEYEAEIDEYVRKEVSEICETISIKIGNSDILKMYCKSGEVEIINKTLLIANLIECYPGLTVYEFNYDYVMGMKLFDAKAIATNLLDSLVNIRMGLNMQFGNDHQNLTEEIKAIIKEVVESDDIAISDCFFEFSNSRYDALLKNAEKKRANKKDFSNVIDILNEFKDEAELHEQVDILNRAFTQASANITDGLDEQNKYEVSFNFVTDLIEQLTLAIVYSILTPKVLMLFEVNETIMGGKWKKFTVKDLMMAMRSIIVSIIKEVRDVIIQELTKLVLKQLSPIVAVVTSAIVREQIEAYTDAINDIIRNCPSVWFKIGGSNQDNETKLDTVDYADIDTSITKRADSPQLNNC